MKGYTGVLLRVDLTTGKITKESIPEEYLKDYIGGSGLATRYLYDEIPSDADPLGPDNKICISVGPLNGGAYPTSGRFNLSCLSPLTGIWLDASSSGKLAYHLKKAGYDAIIMEGVSKEPVYLSIYNGEVELRDASKIWGMKIAPAMEAVFAQCGNNRASISMIGPAGEKLLPMANVMNNKRRTVGRGGAGAVMGSKKLKAIVVYGDRDFEVAEPEEWKAIIKESITFKAMATIFTDDFLRCFLICRIPMCAPPRSSAGIATEAATFSAGNLRDGFAAISAMLRIGRCVNFLQRMIIVSLTN